MRILASWELGLGYGHVATLAPTCRALRALGHHVTLAARSPATAIGLEQDAFDGVVAAPLYPRRPVAGETLTYGQVIAAGGAADPAGATALVRAWLALIARVRPDAVLAEHAPMSLLAAHVAGVPAARIGSSFVAPDAARVGASLLPWAASDAAVLAAACVSADHCVRAICRSLGARPLAGVADLLAGAPNHVLAWPELDHYGPGASRVYYGPLVGIGAHGDAVWPAGEGSRVLVYLPFDRPAATLVLRALGGLGWPVLWHSPTPPVEPLPRSIRYRTLPIDLDTAARSAALYVGRGGYGASARMVAGGVPQLLLPDTLETLLLTYRLRRAGVALSHPVSGGVEGLTDALVRAIGDDRLRSRAAAIARRYADATPAAMTARLLPDLVRALRREKSCTAM